MVDSSDNEYKVGYKRPPLRNRFKSGVSGNPRGRQKGVRNFDVDLKRSLEIPVTLSENGRTKRVSTQEALLLRLREKALKGDGRALEKLLALARTHNVELPSDQTNAGIASAEDEAILDAFREEAVALRSPPRGSAAIVVQTFSEDDGEPT